MKTSYSADGIIKNRVILPGYGSKSSKIDENYVSAAAENQKRLKTVFPPRRKIKKQQKLHFRPGGNAKTTFPPGRKHF